VLFEGKVSRNVKSKAADIDFCSPLQFASSLNAPICKEEMRRCSRLLYPIVTIQRPSAPSRRQGQGTTGAAGGQRGKDQRNSESMLRLEGGVTSSSASSNAAPSPSSAPLAPTTAAPVEKTPWGFAEVDAEGKTELDRLYEKIFKETQKAFYRASLAEEESSLSESPDFLIGFGQYKYRLRDQYREIIWKLLLGFQPSASTGSLAPESEQGLDRLKHLQQIHLSVGWGGFFDLSRMPDSCHKIVGATLLDSPPPSATAFEPPQPKTAGKGPTPSKGDQDKVFRLQVPQGTKDLAIHNLVTLINSRRHEGLLNLNIIGAALPSQSVKSASVTDPDVLKLVDEIRTLVRSNRVVILFRDPMQLAAEVMTYFESLSEEERMFEEVPKPSHFQESFEIQRNQWRKRFYDSHVVPMEINVDQQFAGRHRFTVDSAVRMVCAGRLAYPAYFIGGSYTGSDYELTRLGREREKLKRLLQSPHLLQFESQRHTRGQPDPSKDHAAQKMSTPS
jgi:hypothetical protein